MMESKKTAPSAATLRAEAETAIGGASISKDHNNTAAACRQAGFVESFLPHGAAHAIPTAALVTLCGFRSARELQKQIERERMTGALILSRSGDGGGYYLPDDGEAGRREIAAFVRTVTARALNSMRMLRGARRALRLIDGQTAMEGYK